LAEIFTSQGAPPVSTTLVAILPPVSTTPTVNFATGAAVVSLIPAAHQWFTLSYENLRQFSKNGPHGMLRGLGEIDFKKILKSKIS
jgi:hypothetical protein